MKPTAKNIKQLRQIAHHLKPVLIIGKSGLTPAVLNEFENSIEHHELIKIKISVEDADLRKKVIEELISKSQIYVVQKIGHTVTFYRRAKKPKIVFVQ